jgi:stalled ribosome rescue protein Dom34
VYAFARIALEVGELENPCMTNHYHALVWLDHRVAKIFHFDADDSQRETVNSTHPHENLHHKANSSDSGHAPVDKDYLERVTKAIATAGAILVAGPGSAKTELHTHIEKKHPQIAAKISAVETIDHPSDGALLAHARQFFKADDRMRSQIRS